MQFRLRHQNQDLELARGELVVGRSASCQLSLEDPLVSRRHALFIVTADGLWIEDLASRNGVLVNGEKIAERTQLSAGDRISLGDQELTVSVPGDGANNDTISEEMSAGVRPESKPSGLSSTGRFDGSPAAEPETNTYRRGDALEMLTGVGEKALAMGRVDEALRLVGTLLVDVMESCRNGKHPVPALVDVVGRFAAKLATATGKGSWVDYVVELYELEGRPCAGPVVDELYSAFRRATDVDLPKFRAYVGSLRPRVATFGPAEKFLFHRLEGLERHAGLR
jgi:hypothetical protein